MKKNKMTYVLIIVGLLSLCACPNARKDSSSDEARQNVDQTLNRHKF